MTRTEIKIGGLGGQGVILSGMIIGRAAAIHANRHATLIQSFGPEARGSSCGAQVIVSDTPVEYPYVTSPQILVVMSQDALTKFLPELAPGGTLITEQELVKVPALPAGIRHWSAPATRIAEELGRRIVLNIVMVGFFAGVTALVPAEHVEKAVGDLVPPGTQDLNLRAFRKGLECGLAQCRS